MCFPTWLLDFKWRNALFAMVDGHYIGTMWQFGVVATIVPQ